MNLSHMFKRQAATHPRNIVEVRDKPTSLRTIDKKMACTAMRDTSPAAAAISAPHQEGLQMDRPSSVEREEMEGEHMEAIRVSYSEASLEIAQSETSEDGSVFLNSARMGLDLVHSKNYMQALSVYRIALHCKNATIDSEPKHIQEKYADILFNIGHIHLLPQFDDKSKSLEAFHFCLDLRRMCFGSSHPSVAAVLYKLASIYDCSGEKQYALELLLEAHSILLFENDNKLALAAVWTAVGKVQQALGRADEAESSFQEAARLK